MTKLLTPSPSETSVPRIVTMFRQLVQYIQMAFTAVPGGPFTINFNGSPILSYPFAVPALTLSGQLPAPTLGETILLLDAYGTNANGTLLFSKINGTPSAPSATQNQDIIGLLTSSGWGATGRTTQGATIQWRAEENYTDSKWGTSIGFYAAPIGGNAVAELMRVGPAGVSFSGTANIATSWATYTPTVTANSGTFTSVSATGRYKQIGKTVFVQIKVVDTTNGTAAGFVIATLPVAPVLNSSFALSGFEGVSGFSVAGNISTAGGGVVNIFKYDGTFPLASADSVWVSGVYEAA